LKISVTSNVQPRILRPPIIWADKAALIVALVLFFFLTFLWAFTVAIAGTVGANHILRSWIISGIELDLLIVGSVWMVSRGIDSVIGAMRYGLFVRKAGPVQRLPLE